jgi:hypothetical protein
MGSVLAFLAGLQLPVADNNWTNYVDASPKIGVRAGAVQGALAGMVSADFTPERLTAKTSMPGGFDAGASAYRFRFLAHLGFEHPVTEKLTVTARVGAGLDLAHGSYDFTVLGVRSQSSESDLGFAFEFGGGIWWDIGSAQIGGELAVPIGNHDKASQNGSVGFQYTSYDIDMLFAVRVLGN